MSSHSRLAGHVTAAAAGAALVAGVLVVAPVGAQAADQGRGHGFTATRLQIKDRVTAPKSTTGRLAESSKSLLRRSDGTVVPVMVKLDFDAAASYSGDIAGLSATSPRVTGRALDGTGKAEVAYTAYADGMVRDFSSALRKAVPSAVVTRSFVSVYGGVSVRLPANRAKDLLELPGVAAVQADKLNKVQTDSSGAFIGAPTIWNQQGGRALGGKGVIFADLDTGVWPEHPSFADRPELGDPPATSDGHPRACDFGDNPLTPETDVFVCNHKLIGGQPFLDTYNAYNPGEVYPDSARDSDGHGTHTTSTAAGNVVEHATVFGVDRGTISGIAPGAWVLEYKVCGLEGCYSSDSAAAVAQAVADGADVINFSISGGENPFADPVEMAFLDAYNAGVTVAASAGNSGPAAGTTAHLSPWVITVAASTQRRAFQSTLTVSDGPVSKAFVGASITPGVTTPTPVVLAQDIPGYDALCSTELSPGQAAGKIVACQRGTIGRVQKGYNVLQGGAAGMILYNPTLMDVETDNHFLPAVHLADGTAFLSFMVAHPSATATFTAGAKGVGKGDVMAAFSSRGPGGLFLKPDITAPGVEILAGNTPTPDDAASGPSGEYYQAIAGTSMSAPHIAGSAILLQSLHRGWGPGAIKSALMTTAKTKILKEDEKTPADPFDDGAGRVNLNLAGKAPIVFSDSATRMAALGNDPLRAMQVNLASLNVPTMPGSIQVVRKAKNVSGKTYRFTVSTKAPKGATITVSPRSGVIKKGKSRTFRITITSTAKPKQYFGQIDFRGGATAVHLPVAFYKQQGAVSLKQTCTKSAVRAGKSTTCRSTVTNKAFEPSVTTARTSVSGRLRITKANAAKLRHGVAVVDKKVLAPQKDAIPSIAVGDTPDGGYLDLDLLGVDPEAIGDEEAFNYDVPAFVFGGRTYTRLGVVSNGYVVLGGAQGSQDITYAAQHLPDPASPNGVLAPYWTDLDGTGADGIRAALVTDVADNGWLVVQWNVHLWGQPSATRSMQVWIGLNGTEDISYGYDTDALNAPGDPDAGLTVGVENTSGTAGAQIGTPPQSSYVVSTTPGKPGGSMSWTVTVRGTKKGSGVVHSAMHSDLVAGTTTARSSIRVKRRQ